MNYHRAFRIPIGTYTLSSSHELPALAGQTGTAWRSEGFSINAAGEIVGKAQNNSGSYRAFIHRPGASALIDLTSYVPSATGQWVLTSAACISDAGHIIGTGTFNGSVRQWLMVPVFSE